VCVRKKEREKKSKRNGESEERERWRLNQGRVKREAKRVTFLRGAKVVVRG